MKKRMIYISLLFVAAIALIGAYLSTRVSVPINHKHAKKTYAIALILPAAHPSLDAIAQGFVDTMNTQVSIKHTLFNANNDRSLMNAQLNEIITQKYDLVVTLGATASLMAKEVLTQRKSTLPLVFAAVSNPLKLGLVSNMSQRPENITGVSESRNYEEQLKLLQFLKPHTKNILLVYDPTQAGGLRADRDNIAAFCKQASLNLRELIIAHARDIYQKTAPLLEGIDVVLVLKDNTVVSGIEALINLCNKHGVTLYVSDLDSVDKGAALGYGVHERDFGVQAAHKALAILTGKQSVKDLPVTGIEPFYIKINKKALDVQKLKLDQFILTLIAQGEAV